MFYNLDIEKYLNGPMKEIPVAFVKKWNQYIRLFKNVGNETAIGEASSTYFFSKTAPQEIKKYVPHAKIILLLRNPTDRAFSHYMLNRMHGLTNESFEDAIRAEPKLWKSLGFNNNPYVELGFYYNRVKKFFKIFSEKNVKVCLFDDFIKNEEGILKDVFNFLNVRTKYNLKSHMKSNQSLTPRLSILYFIYEQTRLRIMLRKSPFFVKNMLIKTFFSENKPPIPEKGRAYLKKTYKSDIFKLSKLLKKDLSSWLNR